MDANTDVRSEYLMLCSQYSELEEQQRTYPSQWGEIEKEKQVISRKLAQDFRDCQFAEFADSAFMRSHYQPARKMPEWIMVCIFIGVIVGMVALSLDYFEVLRRSS